VLPQVRMSRNPISPRVPAFLGRWIFDGSPPWLRVLETVAPMESGISYQVSWGMETARMPEPPRTGDAETTEQRPPLTEVYVWMGSNSIHFTLGGRPFKQSGGFL